MEAVMEGCEGWESGGGSALGLVFNLLQGSDDVSCFVIMIQNYFLTDSPYLPVMCVFLLPVFQLQCRAGQYRIYWCCGLV